MIKQSAFLLLLLPMAALAAGPAKQRAASTPPPTVAHVFACRSIGDPVARLACFDREVATFDQAQASGEIVTMDRQDVRATRRSLFGLALPNLGLFGDNSVDANSGVLETTIISTRQGPDGKWSFVLAEGGRWVQLDNREFIDYPASGMPIIIRRAAMGSFLANIKKQTAIRIERVR